MTDDERDLRTAMVATCRAMDAKGINQGTAGNLSLRFGDWVPDHAVVAGL